MAWSYWSYWYTGLSQSSEEGELGSRGLKAIFTAPAHGGACSPNAFFLREGIEHRVSLFDPNRVGVAHEPLLRLSVGKSFSALFIALDGECILQVGTPRTVGGQVRWATRLGERCGNHMVSSFWLGHSPIVRVPGCCGKDIILMPSIPMYYVKNRREY